MSKSKRRITKHGVAHVPRRPRLEPPNPIIVIAILAASALLIILLIVVGSRYPRHLACGLLAALVIAPLILTLLASSRRQR